MTHTIKIVSRYDSERVLYECEVTDEEHASGIGLRHASGIGLRGANLRWADLSGADLSGSYLARADLAVADLYGAYLAGANLDGANLARADLAGANLARADLAGAYLDGANLDGANLAGANLAGANLAGANLNGAKIVRKVAQVRRDDGHEFIAFAMDDGRTIIRAGCRTMTPAEYRKHVAKEYPGTAKAGETLAILDFIERRVKETS